MTRRLTFVALAIVLVAATTPPKMPAPLDLVYPISGTACASAACKAHVLVVPSTKTVPAASTVCPKYDWVPQNPVPSHPPLRFAGPINIGNIPTPPPMPIGVDGLGGPIALETHATKSGTEMLMTVSHCSTVAGHLTITTQIVHVPIATGANITVDTYRGTLLKR
jgi:hypothetical protein